MTDFEDANDNEGSLLVIRLVTLCPEAGWYSWLRAAAISVIMLSHCNFKRNHTLFRRGFHEAAAKANLRCQMERYYSAWLTQLCQVFGALLWPTMCPLCAPWLTLDPNTLAEKIS